ncbi:MAG: hypothetical protein P1U81_07950 [Verrucomicrobiales bacterium]|nr:hypothetical protein [Verrucomicrobiales bacterium]
MSRIISLLSIAISAVAFVEVRNPNVLIILVNDMGFGDLGACNPNSKIVISYLNERAAGR